MKLKAHVEKEEEVVSSVFRGCSELLVQKGLSRKLHKTTGALGMEVELSLRSDPSCLSLPPFFPHRHASPEL